MGPFSYISLSYRYDLEARLGQRAFLTLCVVLKMVTEER